MVGEPTRVTTAGDSAKCRERWGRIIWRMKGQCNGGGRCVESGRDEDVELHDGGYCDVGFILVLVVEVELVIVLEWMVLSVWVGVG